MKKWLIAVPATATLVISATSLAVAQQTEFQASLRGAEEVPAISTQATGDFRAVLDEGRQQIRYVLRYSGIEGGEAFAAHIHLGQRNVNGGVIAFLCGGGGKPDCPARSGEVRGVIRPSDIIGPESQGIAPGEFQEAVRAMFAGLTYANVHSEKFPGGEIRGQIHS